MCSSVPATVSPCQVLEWVRLRFQWLPRGVCRVGAGVVVGSLAPEAMEVGQPRDPLVGRAGACAGAEGSGPYGRRASVVPGAPLFVCGVVGCVVASERRVYEQRCSGNGAHS